MASIFGKPAKPPKDGNVIYNVLTFSFDGTHMLHMLTVGKAKSTSRPAWRISGQTLSISTLSHGGLVTKSFYLYLQLIKKQKISHDKYMQHRILTNQNILHKMHEKTNNGANTHAFDSVSC